MAGSLPATWSSGSFVAKSDQMQPSLLRPRSLWLVVAPILLCCFLTFGSTLSRPENPTPTRSGNFRHVNEMSPSFGRYLAITRSPLVRADLDRHFLDADFDPSNKMAMTISICVVMGT